MEQMIRDELFSCSMSHMVSTWMLQLLCPIACLPLSASACLTACLSACLAVAGFLVVGAGFLPHIMLCFCGRWGSCFQSGAPQAGWVTEEEMEGLANCLRHRRGALGRRDTALSAYTPLTHTHTPPPLPHPSPNADYSSVSIAPCQKASLMPKCTFINAHFQPFRSIPI